MEVRPWLFVLAPAGTPQPIIDKLAAEIARIGATADFQDYLARQGMNPYITGTDTLAAMVTTELAKWATVIKTANIKL